MHLILWKWVWGRESDSLAMSVDTGQSTWVRRGKGEIYQMSKSYNSPQPLLHCTSTSWGEADLPYQRSVKLERSRQSVDRCNLYSLCNLCNPSDLSDDGCEWHHLRHGDHRMHPSFPPRSVSHYTFEHLNSWTFEHSNIRGGCTKQLRISHYKRITNTHVLTNTAKCNLSINYTWHMCNSLLITICRIGPL